MPRFLNVACVTALMALVASGPLDAQLGGRPAEQWALVLESGRRLGSLEIENVVSLIGIEEGQVVADLGAGTGVFSVPLARAAGTTGTVLAVEVDAGFLPMIDEKARQAGLENVQGVLGEFADPNLPRRDVDVAFFHDVLHHIDERQAYLLTVASYMAPGSRMVVVDYDMNQPGVPHGNQPEMLISPQQVAEWMANAGFVVSREVDLFEEKFFVIYTKVGQ